MDAPELIFQALESQQPRMALQRVMQRYLEAGMERQEILSVLEDAQQRLRAQGRDEQAEWVAELLDGLDGWCRI
jgi:hypothetical protein